MTGATDILVLGTGSFAERIVCDLGATTRDAVAVAIGGRNVERLRWLVTAANGRAALFGGKARFFAVDTDVSSPDRMEEVLVAVRPRVVVQTASTQTSSVIADQDSAWAALVARGGLSATAVFQCLLSARVARAMKGTGSAAAFVNCCFPDVVNGMLAALGANVLCGVGNVAILSNAFAGHACEGRLDRVKVLAHYQNLAAWRLDASRRAGIAPSVWIDGRSVGDVYARFADVRLPAAPAVEISGASGVPLFTALALGRSWSGHVPGPAGLPGGYPVRLSDGRLQLDLPHGTTREEAVEWNAGFERKNGLVVDGGGHVSYTGRLYDALNAASPALAQGFHMDDLEEVHSQMEKLRTSMN